MYIHTYIHTYVRTYVHTYRSCQQAPADRSSRPSAYAARGRFSYGDPNNCKLIIVILIILIE